MRNVMLLGGKVFHTFMG